MVALAPIIASAFSAASAVAPLLSVAGTAVSAIGQHNAGMYQASILQQQAQRDAFNGQIQTQDAGLQAAQSFGTETAAIGASGASLASPAAQNRIAMLRILGARDEQRLSADASVRSQNSSADAAMARSSAHNALIGGIFNIGGDLLNNATLVNRRKVDSLNYSTRNVPYGN